MNEDTIGNYRLLRRLNKGDVAIVYEAVYTSNDRRVAIKVLRQEFAGNGQKCARFFNEARTISTIDHPGIVEVLEFSRLADGTAFFVMEFLHGETLGDRLYCRDGPLPLLDTLRITRQIAEAMTATHKMGVIHRDLEPGNVMLVPDFKAPGGERIKIFGFGSAKVEPEPPLSGRAALKIGPGWILGNPCYVAPEQCKNASQVTEKADVYSLGVMLYEMLSGELPFDSHSQVELMMMHMLATPKPLGEVDAAIPKPAASLAERMMHKTPEQRPDMAEIVQYLGDW